MIARVLGYKARLCNQACLSGFRTDREAGLMYGRHVINGVTCMHREEWSLAARQCAYCSAPVNGKVPAHLAEKFGVH